MMRHLFKTAFMNISAQKCDANYNPLSFECTDIKTLLHVQRKKNYLGLLKLDYYGTAFAF